MDNIGVIYDIVGIAIILISVILGLSRGFFKNLICIFGNLVSFFISLIFGSYIAKIIYDKFLEKIFYKKVSKLVSDFVADGVASLEDYIDNIPDYLENMSQLLGIDPEKIISDASVASVEKSLMANLVEPAVVLLISIIMFFVAYLILKLVVREIGDLFGHVNEIPILGLVNRLAGGALGLVGGVIYLYIFVMFLKMVIMFTGGEIPYLSLFAVGESHLIKLLFYFKL